MLYTNVNTKVAPETNTTKIFKMLSYHSEKIGKSTGPSFRVFFSIPLPNPTNNPNNYPA